MDEKARIVAVTAAALIAVVSVGATTGQVVQQAMQWEYTAVVENRGVRQGVVEANGIRWTCGGDRCTTRGPWPSPGVAACAALARQVGRLTSYGRPGQQLAATELEQCNSGVSLAPGAGVAQRATGVVAGPDADGDGHRAVSAGGDDCDDRDGNRYPGNPEIADLAGHDEDCDPATFGERDGDGDGFFDARAFNLSADGTRHAGNDCDDTRGNVHPFQAEVCNFVDDNCDGSVDEGVQTMAWRDVDRDLFGDPREQALVCPMQLGPEFVLNNYDCDDRDPRRNPYFGNCGG